MVLVSLIIISELVAQMGDLEGNYDFAAALTYVALLIPGMIYDYLSYATFLGCVIGLGIHANANELVVMRAAGVSLLRIGWAVMRPVLLVIALGVLWGAFVTPVSTELAENSRSAALMEQDALTEEGIWHREGDVFAHFESVQSNGRLFGVTRYRFDDQGRLQSSLYAEEAIYQDDYWLLENGSESVFLEDRVEQHAFIQQIWRSELSPEQLKLLVLEPEALSMKDRKSVV